MKKIFYSIVLLMAVALLVSCKEKTAEEVAESFANAFHNMDYNTAKSLATENSAKQLDMLAQMASSLPESENAKKVIITMGKGSVNGDKATYYYTPSDIAEPQRINLVKVNGKWLVAWNKNDNMNQYNPNNPQTPGVILETQPEEEIEIKVDAAKAE